MKRFNTHLIFLLLLGAFLGSLSSCIQVDEENNRFQNNRGKKDRTDREPKGEEQQQQTAEQQPETQTNTATTDATPSTVTTEQKESLVFPIRVSQDLKSLSINSTDNKNFVFSSTQGVLSLVAPLSGTISVKKSGQNLHLVLTPKSNPKKVLNFLFEEEGSELKVRNNTEVNQNQILSESSKPITFYILENEEKNIICLNVKSTITIISNIPNNSNCS